MSKEGVVMKVLYRGLVVASLLLWTDHLARAQEEYPPLPEEIPEDVDGAMERIGAVLKEMGVKALESVVVVGLTDEEELQVSFANATKRDAAEQAVPCDVPTGQTCSADPTSPSACQPALPALLVPKCDPTTGQLIEWYAGFTDSANPPQPYKLKYKGSPGTSLDCGNNLGGSRPCRNY